EEVLLAAGRAVELDAVARAGPVDRDAEAVVADAPQELEDAVDVERVLEARRRVVAEDEPATAAAAHPERLLEVGRGEVRLAELLHREPARDREEARGDRVVALRDVRRRARRERHPRAGEDA